MENATFEKMNHRKFTFGLTIITRNEYEKLERILKFADAFDQVVVVDTGSEDGTKELIKENFPFVEVYDFKWNNNFSDARNFSLSKLQTDVFIWLDSDDTFDVQTLFGWFSIAKDISEKENLCHAVLPYYYWVDENDEPILIQYRERIIKNPKAWEWREPIHEVCCTKDDAPSEAVFITNFPVIHRPNKAGADMYRNWRILHKHVDDGACDVRTLYYIQREALDRGQLEYAILMGQKLLDMNPLEYFLYDIYRYMGDAYTRMYDRDKIEEYVTKAKDLYQKSIQICPERNESRDTLIQLLLNVKDYYGALEETNKLNETYPMSVATLSTDKYGSYKHAMLSMIYFRYFEMLSSSLDEHFKSLSHTAISDLCLSNDLNLRKHMDINNIGIIYSDHEYLNNAMLLKKELIAADIFSDVVITTSPLALGFGRHWYFHISKNIDTCYLEDGNPHTKKYFISDIPEIPVGWHDTFNIPSNEDEVKFIIDELLTETTVYDRSKDLTDFGAFCKETDKKYVIGAFGEFKPDISFDQILRKFTLNKEVVLIVNRKAQLLSIAGKVDNLNKYLYGTNIMYLDNRENIRVVEIEQYGIKNTEGIVFSMVQLTKSKGRIAFFTGGMEPWDGRIPYNLGVGASETCLIYLAEELVKQNYDVMVYNSVTKPVKVSGVQYFPNSYFNEGVANLDLLIASRAPDLLKEKRFAKKQVVWLHDLPEVYRNCITKQHNVDYYICISDWQKEKFKEEFKDIADYKIKVIPNGFFPNKFDSGIKKVKNRMVWLSSPDRGIIHLAETLNMRKTQDENYLPDAWMFYGFYNMRIAYPDNVQFYKYMHRTKEILRRVGIRIGGRVNMPSLRRFLQTCDMMPYMSSFGETSCQPAGSLVFTKNGMKPIEQIKVGDEVLTCFNRFKKVVKLYERDYSGKLYGFIREKDADKTWFTSEHQLWTATGWNESANIHTGDLLYSPNNVCGSLEYIKLSDYIGDMSNIRVIGEDIRSTSRNPKCISIKNNRKLIDMAWIMGLFLADGSASVNKNINRSKFSTISFACHSKQMEFIVGKIKQAFPEVSISTSVQGKYTGVIVFHHAPLAKFLRENIGSSLEKRVPSFIWDSTPEIQQEFLSGYLYGDGHITPRGYNTHSTISPSVAYGIAQLCANFGIFPSMTYNANRRAYTLTIIPNHDGTREIYCGDMFATNIKDIIVREYSGRVYDFEVEDDHSYVCNRTIAHNCVSVVEALHNNVKPYINKNGAVAETVNRALDKKVADKVVLPTGKEEQLPSDYQRWLDAMKNHKSITNTTINNSLLWENIAKDYWIPLTGKE